MNVELNTSEPPTPTTGNGSNPWKIFGIAVIVLALTAGVGTVGFLLGASEEAQSTRTNKTGDTEVFSNERALENRAAGAITMKGAGTR